MRQTYVSTKDIRARGTQKASPGLTDVSQRIARRFARLAGILRGGFLRFLHHHQRVRPIPAGDGRGQDLRARAAERAQRVLRGGHFFRGGRALIGDEAAGALERGQGQFRQHAHGRDRAGRGHVEAFAVRAREVLHAR